MLDASFSADGQSIYLAHTGGISRTAVARPDQVELVTDLMQHWALKRADFAPDASYVLFMANPHDQPSYWLYKVLDEE